MKANILFAFAGLTAATLLTGCATSDTHPAGEPAPGMSVNSAAGAVLADQKGMTLYTYDEDDTNTSNCTGMCAVAWPPVFAPDGATASGHLTVITRPNGTKQWAQDGKPLYTYYRDRKAGDITGDNVEGTWHLARPE
jgi:predicted lipoprotein with Yx(FWY)xxD motif